MESQTQSNGLMLHFHTSKSGTCMPPNSTKQSNGRLKLLNTAKSALHGTLPSTKTSRNTLAPVPGKSVANSHMCQGSLQGFAQCDFRFYHVDSEWQQ